MQRLTELAKSVYIHPALNNKFYDLWLHHKLSVEQIAIFVRNYWEFAACFPENLAILFLNVNNVTARAEYAKTLYSEMGYGNPKQAHTILFEMFFNDLAHALGKADTFNIEYLKKHCPLLPETTNFIEGQKTLYSHKRAIAVGAQLALEWQAYSMIRQLYEGARNYMDYWPHQDAFHESCEFFYIHIGTAEKEHKNESLIAAEKIIEEDGCLEDVVFGFNHHLELIAQFWNGITIEIEAQHLHCHPTTPQSNDARLLYEQA